MSCIFPVGFSTDVSMSTLHRLFRDILLIDVHHDIEIVLQRYQARLGRGLQRFLFSTRTPFKNNHVMRFGM